jgi:hypothetical protein
MVMFFGLKASLFGSRAGLEESEFRRTNREAH